jgi:hypothetical protein
LRKKRLSIIGRQLPTDLLATLTKVSYRMQKYDPMLNPDPEQWVALDDDERISLVMEYHQEVGIEPPDEYTHALIHVVVENQIALGEETPVDAVLDRLIDENLDRHDSIHAIASILANHMYELMHGEDAALGNDEYYAELENLTAEKWLRNEYTED